MVLLVDRIDGDTVARVGAFARSPGELTADLAGQLQ